MSHFNHLGNRKKQPPAAVRSLVFLRMVVIGLVVHFAGCQQGATLSGTVTIEGKPLTEGKVVFTGDGLPASYATIGSDGSYYAKKGTAPAIEPGKYQATVHVFRIIPNKNPRVPPTYLLISPKKYGDVATSELGIDVLPNKKTVYDIDLKGKLQ